MDIGKESFYRPYKGLKQKFLQFLNDAQKSFYRPYKGLKLAKTYIKYMLSSCFYRPYKGLKQQKQTNDTTIYNKFLSSL